MIERVLRFGPGNELTGVYAASGQEKDASRTAVLFLTAGLLHKVGPNRLHVELARRLAGHGHATLRFDMSGIGDSPSRADGVSEEARAVQDTMAAMDALQKRFGHDRFVLFGLCSGADNAHPTALRDRRVAGIICLDAYIYKTPRCYLHSHLYRYLAFLLSPKRVTGYLRRRLAGTVRKYRSDATERLGEADDAFVRPFPPKEKVVTELQQLVDRGVRLFFIYSGAYSLYYYSGQFHDCFKEVRFGDRLTFLYNEKADHTYNLGRDRRILIHSVLDWVLEGSAERS